MFAAPSEPVLRVRLFGTFEVKVRGKPIRPLRGRTSRWLLALLALRGGQAVERPLLRAMLWPDSDDAASSQNLRRALGDLRDALGEAADRLYSPTARTLALDVTRGVWVDALAFDAAGRRTTPDIEEMTALHRGPLLAGCDETWVQSEREARFQAFLDALETLGSRAQERGDTEEAARYFRRLLEADPARESAVSRLMNCLTDRGDYAAVVRVYNDFRLRLRAEYNTEPSAETTARYRALRTRASLPADTRVPPAPGSDADRAPTAVPAPPASSLPRPITTLLGRDEAIRGVAKRLREARLITLVGAGGVGKTRLAIAVGNAVSADFPDGACFADLSPLIDAETDAVPMAVGAACLNASPDANMPTVTVANTIQLIQLLRPLRLLLILDNAEHLIDRCAELVRTLLHACPNLHVLATSREPLGLTGEILIPVLPLRVPEAVTGGAMVASSDAVRLFLERGRAVRPDLVFDAKTAPAITEICRRLDGLPLAIELAAARLAVLSVEEIAGRLDDRFTLLTTGERGAAPRQRALRSVLDWSHDLLSDADRMLLRRLSVFPGHFGLAAARAVCFDSAVGETDALDRLTRLSSRSLLVAENHPSGGEEGRGWFRLLETVRQYAAEQLGADGEAAEARERHASYFLTRAEAAEIQIHEETQVSALAEMTRLYDDLRVALAWWLRPGAPVGEGALRLARALGPFWKLRGYAPEGCRWLADALDRAPDAPPLLRAHCLIHLGALALMRGDPGRARRAYEESLGLFRQLSDAGGTGVALGNLGEIAATAGRLTDARRLHDESLAQFRLAKNRLGEAYALNNLGNVSRSQGALPAARDYYQGSFGLFRQLGDRIGQGYAVCGMGNVAKDMKDPEAATRYYRQALELQEATGDKGGAAMSLNNLGAVAQERGDTATARTYYEQSVTLWRQAGNLAWVTDTLTRLEKMAGAAGDFAGAERYHAEAAAHARLMHAESTQAGAESGIVRRG